MLRILSEAINDLPIEVLTATTAEGGLEAMQSLVTDLVVQDVFMPGRGGLWAIEQIRIKDPSVKILAISGGWGSMESNKTLKAAKVLGCDACLVKPFKLEVFREKVLELLGGELFDEFSTQGQAETPAGEAVRLSEA